MKRDITQLPILEVARQECFKIVYYYDKLISGEVVIEHPSISKEEYMETNLEIRNTWKNRLDKIDIMISNIVRSEIDNYLDPPIDSKNKEKYFNDNYPFAPIPKLTDKMNCAHCGETIIVGDYKVIDGLISCPNSPKCDGTIIDWFPINELETTK